MIETFLNMIKKFFSIVLSFVFGFNYDKTELKKSPNDSQIIKNNFKKKSSNSEKASSTPTSDSNNEKLLSNNLYIKDDIQQIYNIVRTLDQLENKVAKITNQLDVQLLKQKLVKVKSQLTFLENKYDNIKINDVEIVKIKQKIESCNKIVKVVQVNIENAVIKPINKEKIIENKKKDKKLPKFIETTNNKVQLPIQHFTNIKEKVSNYNVLIRKKDLKEEKKQSSVTVIDKDLKYIDVNKKQLDNPILSNVITNNNDSLKKKNILLIMPKPSKKKTTDKTDNIENKKIKDNIPEIIYSSDKVNKQKNVKEKHEKSIEHKISLKDIKQDTVDLSLKINALSLSIKSASKLANTLSLLKFAKNKKSKLLATNILINNHIRKGRKINNKRVRILKFENIIKKIPGDKEPNIIQINSVMINTIKQINFLRREIYTNYKLDEKILRLLDELNEIEMLIQEELRNQKDESEKKSRMR